MSAACRSCGAAIIWARTMAGKRMPLDAEPHPGAPVALAPESDVAIVCSALPRHGEVRYMPHWVTCPHADQHRRTR